MDSSNAPTRQFVRGAWVVLVTILIELLVQFTFRPPQLVSYALTYGTVSGLLALGVVAALRRRPIGRGMLLAWVLFILVPVAFVLILGFTGNLMSP
ncbi:MAG: hypothetical protein HY567_03010 [Candidatus Kerfeldbacteria bacterium]|nr:hypothetical protein [Candidatus Kerfeldbacteria bacterium]